MMSKCNGERDKREHERSLRTGLHGCHGVGVVIRSVELYDLVNTALWFFWFRLRTPSFTIKWNWFVGVGSRSGRTKPITKRWNLHFDWFILVSLLLPTPTIWFSPDHKWDVSDGVVTGVGKKWKRSDSSDSDSVALMTPLTTPIFDFPEVIRALTTPLRTLKNPHFLLFEKSRGRRSLWCGLSLGGEGRAITSPH